MKKIGLLLFGYFIITAFTAVSAQPPSHGIWNSLLQKYVNENGFVNYKGFINDRVEFQKYLDILSNNPPEDNWSKEDKEAYWINAYNAFTVKLIIDHYPVKSIKDIGPKHQIPFVNTPWQKKFFKIGKEEYKLDKIEHQILRKQFNDPRVHFAIVCASWSCAKLRNEAYEGSRLNKQLDDQAKDFLTDKRKNIITPEKAQLSSYFEWYRKDFEKKGVSFIDFINQYSPIKIKKDADISYLDYNWALNEQK
ncbi:MAG: hypothetical protein NVSMB24_26970 [Mucilaginibacter sp.]